MRYRSQKFLILVSNDPKWVEETWVNGFLLEPFMTCNNFCHSLCYVLHTCVHSHKLSLCLTWYNLPMVTFFIKEENFHAIGTLCNVHVVASIWCVHYSLLSLSGLFKHFEYLIILPCTFGKMYWSPFIIWCLCYESSRSYWVHPEIYVFLCMGEMRLVKETKTFFFFFPRRSKCTFRHTRYHWIWINPSHSVQMSSMQYV